VLGQVEIDQLKDSCVPEPCPAARMFSVSQVPELQEKLRVLGLPATGKKAVLPNPYNIGCPSPRGQAELQARLRHASGGEEAVLLLLDRRPGIKRALDMSACLGRLMTLTG